MTRPSWDQTWMAVAETMAQRAECTRAKVGCVVVVENKGVWVGYNGAASGERHCTDGGCPRGLVPKDPDLNWVLDGHPIPDPGKRDCVALHAEANALARAGDRAVGGVCYVTKKPCLWCVKTMRACGVKRVMWLEDGRLTPSTPRDVAVLLAELVLNAR